MKSVATLSDKERAIFAEIAATPQLAGTVLENIDRLLAIIGTEGVPVSPKTSEFAIARLPELNVCLVEPTNIGLARGRQQSYPHLDGLHMLLRSGALCKIDRSQKTPRMIVDPSMHQRWQALNATERYFSLLDFWWSDASDGQFRNGFRANEMANYRYKLLQRVSLKGETIDEKARRDDPYFRLLGLNQIALMQMFGMLDIRQGKTLSGEGWLIERMAATPWGLAASKSFVDILGDNRLVELLLGRLGGKQSEANESFEDRDGEEEEEIPTFRWFRQIQPFFPELRHLLGQPEPAAPLLGSITLKVSLSKEIWRRIVLPSDCTFADLAMTILSAFKFDDDHLYEFRYVNEYGIKQMLDDPRCEEMMGDDYADNVELGQVPLVAKQKIDFRYDFGDDWRFEVLVEKIDPLKTVDQAKVIEKAGRAPKQYRWD